MENPIRSRQPFSYVCMNVLAYVLLCHFGSRMPCKICPPPHPHAPHFTKLFNKASVDTACRTPLGKDQRLSFILDLPPMNMRSRPSRSDRLSARSCPRDSVREILSARFFREIRSARSCPRDPGRDIPLLTYIKLDLASIDAACRIHRIGQRLSFALDLAPVLV